MYKSGLALIGSPHWLVAHRAWAAQALLESVGMGLMDLPFSRVGAGGYL